MSPADPDYLGNWHYFTAGNRWLVKPQKRGPWFQHGGRTQGSVCLERQEDQQCRGKNTDDRLAVFANFHHPFIGMAGGFRKPAFRCDTVWEHHPRVRPLVRVYKLSDSFFILRPFSSSRWMTAFKLDFSLAVNILSSLWNCKRIALCQDLPSWSHVFKIFDILKSVKLHFVFLDWSWPKEKYTLYSLKHADFAALFF